MCLPAATMLPLAIGGAMQVGSMLMQRNAQSEAASRQGDITRQMLALGNQNRQQNFLNMTRDMQRYQPEKYDREVAAEESDIVTRSGEQYQAAQARAPDVTYSGVTTPSFQETLAQNEVDRASEAMDRAKSYASMVAPSYVNAEMRRGTARSGEQSQVNNLGYRPQQELLEMEYGAVRPNYSIAADLGSAFGSALTMHGLSKIPWGGSAGAWTAKPHAGFNAWDNSDWIR